MWTVVIPIILHDHLSIFIIHRRYQPPPTAIMWKVISNKEIYTNITNNNQHTIITPIIEDYLSDLPIILNMMEAATSNSYNKIKINSPTCFKRKGTNTFSLKMKHHIMCIMSSHLLLNIMRVRHSTER